MNYLTEINAFERRMRRHPLPMSAQLLWYKLMQFANRLYWPEWFAVDNDRLAELLGSSTGTARTARDQLVEGGYLEHQRGTKKHPNKYRLIPPSSLEKPFSYTDIPKAEGIEEYYDEAEDITRYFGYTEAIGLELKKTVDEIFGQFWPDRHPDKSDEIRVFRLIFETHKDENGNTVMTLPSAKKALLAYAFDQASRAGAVNWNYIDGIYRHFHYRGIKTVDDAYDYDYERDKQRY